MLPPHAALSPPRSLVHTLNYGVSCVKYSGIVDRLYSPYNEVGTLAARRIFSIYLLYSHSVLWEFVDDR